MERPSFYAGDQRFDNLLSAVRWLAENGTEKSTIIIIDESGSIPLFYHDVFPNNATGPFLLATASGTTGGCSELIRG